MLTIVDWLSSLRTSFHCIDYIFSHKNGIVHTYLDYQSLLNTLIVVALKNCHHIDSHGSKKAEFSYDLTIILL